MLYRNKDGIILELCDNGEKFFNGEKVTLTKLEKENNFEVCCKDKNYSFVILIKDNVFEIEPLQIVKPPKPHKNKHIIFCTSYITKDTKKRYENWFDYYKNIYGDTVDFLFVNDGIVDDSVGISENWNVIEHNIHLGNHSGKYNFQGWIRSFLTGVDYCLKNNYEFVAHVESDCYIKKTFCEKFLELMESGKYISGWTKYGFMETAIQILNNEISKKILNFFKEESSYKINELFEPIFFKNFNPEILLKTYRLEYDDIKKIKHKEHDFLAQVWDVSVLDEFNTEEVFTPQIIIKKKIAIIKSIVNSKERLHDPEIVFSNCDYFAYVSDKIDSKIWKQMDFFKIKKTGKYSNRINSRYPKILSHKILQDYSYFIWLDAGHDVVVDPNMIIETYLKDHDASFFKHPYRNCIYEEAKTVINMGYDSVDCVKKQMDFYKRENFPENYGLFENSAFIRKNNNNFNLLAELWWEQIIEHSSRDQLSLMYCLWKQNGNVKINTFPNYARSPEGNNNILRQTKQHITSF